MPLSHFWLGHCVLVPINIFEGKEPTVTASLNEFAGSHCPLNLVFTKKSLRWATVPQQTTIKKAWLRELGPDPVHIEINAISIGLMAIRLGESPRHPPLDSFRV